MSIKRWSWLPICCFLSACGHDGALYLPDDPAASAQASATTNTSGTHSALQTTDKKDR